MSHDHDVAAVADRVDDRVRVFPPAGRLFVAREVDRDRVVPTLAQLGGDEVPVPRAPTAPVMSVNVTMTRRLTSGVSGREYG